MGASFPDLNTDAGLKALNDHLAPYSYIAGYTGSKDDLIVYTALKKAPDAKQYPHASRWWNHITNKLKESFEGFNDGKGVQLAGGAAASSSSDAPAAKSAPAAPPAQKAAPARAVSDSDEDDDDEDLDLFGELTPEEKAAKEEKDRIIAEAKKRGEEKAKKTKSMIVMDVKPWDDTTDLKVMEEEVRAIHKDGLLWGKSQLVPIGFGIRKMQITAIIEDAKVESMDAIIEEELVRDGESETIQSIDIVAFNKL
jgi:elongation factor 1-beta